MTDYIEEMMKTAGVEPYPQEILLPNEYEYPMFTAEKQLEIIKLISRNRTFNLSTLYHYRVKEVSLEIIRSDKFYQIVQNSDFPQALAQLTTELMKAGELDKEKVREILNA